MGIYRTIVADPPWDYGRYAKRWPTGPERRAGTEIRRAPMAYTAMPDLEIAALPVADWAAADCRLWLWATSAHLPAAVDVVRAWGFDYRQTLVWHKTGNPSPFGGSVAPNHAEFLLIGVRGQPGGDRLPSSVIEAPKPREHSRKPDLFLDLIESASPSPRLEMFARRDRLGWHTYGDQALGTVLTHPKEEDT